jgi:hypothetical protein
MVLIGARAEALPLAGVTAAPSTVSPGEALTVSGPAIADCSGGTIHVSTGPGAEEYRFGPTIDMRGAWSSTSSEFSRFEVAVQPAFATYGIVITCFDGRGNQAIYETSATFTVAPQDPSTYRALTPARLMDTRPGQTTVDGAAAGTGAVAPGAVQVLQVTGRGGVPGTGVGAVVLNITATGPTAAGFLTVFPTGEARPQASSLNFAAGQTVANLAVAKLGSGGQVSIYNSAGSTFLIADVTGWFPSSATFTPLTPARLLDTRPGQNTIDGLSSGGGPAASGSVRSLKVTGRGGVPASNVGAVILNVTATGPSGPGFVTVYPTGEVRPLASNLNYAAGQTVANLVVAKVGAGGQVDLYNQGGSTHLVADVTGWFPTASSYNPLSPARVLDTRPGQTTVDHVSEGSGAVGPGRTVTVKVTGRGGVPEVSVGAVVLTVTATGPTEAGYLTVYPTGTPRPLASNLNFAPGQTVANLVVTKAGTGGQVTIYNDTGSTHLVADVSGWLTR